MPCCMVWKRHWLFAETIKTKRKYDLVKLRGRWQPTAVYRIFQLCKTKVWCCKDECIPIDSVFSFSGFGGQSHHRITKKVSIPAKGDEYSSDAGQKKNIYLIFQFFFQILLSKLINFSPLRIIIFFKLYFRKYIKKNCK